MLTLANNELRIDMLDPRDAADARHLGWRFAHGGLVWQVSDAKAGPLLTGPEWPAADPDPLNAQGLVDSFRHRTRDKKEPYTWRNGVGVAIGCGRVTMDSNGQVVMTDACRWDVNADGNSRVEFKTADAFAGFDYALAREVHLSGRVLTILTRLTNRGPEPLVLEWFEHPFFDYTNGFIHARLPRDLRLGENPGFTLRDGELTLKRRFTGTNDGCLEVMPWPKGVRCVFSVDHPKLAGIEDELVGLEPFECLVWGNGNTFSIEPYVRLELAPGETREFSLRHVFGAAK